MYSDWPVFAQLAVAVIFIWLGILSFMIWKQQNFLRALFPKSGERDIRIKFEEVVKLVNEFKGDLKGLEEKLLQLDKQGVNHIQKVSLLRYNPYDDTGGNISFSLALLNEGGSGIVVTSLHARNGTRIFAKPVIEGKGQKYQFSKEEKAVLEKALKQKDD
ncbi:MAG: DUF4446 family protein [Patescibacteria group bacterium]